MRACMRADTKFGLLGHDRHSFIPTATRLPGLALSCFKITQAFAVSGIVQAAHLMAEELKKVHDLLCGFV